MTRCAFPLVLQSPVTGSAIVGADATITQHVFGAPSLGSGAAAEIFLSDTEAEKLPSNTIVTDDTGRWTQGKTTGYKQYWLTQGTYDILITGSGLASVYVTREMASGSIGAWEPGDLKLSAAAVVPTGWLPCEAQAISRTTYGTLFTAIGVAYGIGDGLTTFNIPDYRERVPGGAGTSLGSHGAMGGTASSTLTVAQIPRHGHALTDPGHYHTLRMSNGVSGAGPDSRVVSLGDNTIASNYPDGGQGELKATTGITLAETGSNEVHSNLQPYTVCSVWIKT